MADHLGSPPHDPQPEGFLARARDHLVDLTPLKVSRDFRRLFIGRPISDFGDEVDFVFPIVGSATASASCEASARCRPSSSTI